MRNVNSRIYIFYRIRLFLSGSIPVWQSVFRINERNSIYGKVSGLTVKSATFNAFRYGGSACGIFTLLADPLKGRLPLRQPAEAIWGSGCRCLLFRQRQRRFWPRFFCFITE